MNALLMVFCICVLSGCGIKETSSCVPDPVSRICDIAEIRRDWGMDITIRKGSSQITVHEVLSGYCYTDITASVEVAEAKELFKQKPTTPWPSIYAIEAVEGHFALTLFGFSGNRPDNHAIMISRPFLDSSDSTTLAGVLAHEISHPDVGLMGLLDHEQVDLHAAKLAGSRTLLQALQLVLHAQTQYRHRVCPMVLPSFDTLVGVRNGMLKRRIEALHSRFP